MQEPLNLGIDFGSMALRAAYVPAPSGAPEAVAGASQRTAWVLCEPRVDGRLGVGFPSLKEKLGTDAAVGAPEGARSPGELVGDSFRTLKRAVEAELARPVAQAVVSVPARYRASQRSALREAALAAGFADVHLVNDSVAAVLAHTAGRDTPATILVCGIGYSGFELGLVRAVRGNLRALGYEGGGSASGAVLDEVVLDAWLEPARRQGLADPALWDPAQWLQLRAVAQQVKEELSQREQVTYPISIATPDGERTWKGVLQRGDFEVVVGHVVGGALSRAHSLLEEAGLQATDIDEVILVGGITKIPKVAALVRELLGRPTVEADDDLLARGAALHASRLEAKLPIAVERDDPAVAEHRPVISSDVALRAAIVPLDAATGERSSEPLVLLVPGGATSADPGKALDAARAWIARGESERARVFLDAVVADASALLASLPTRVAVPAVASAAVDLKVARLFAKAKRLLDSGRYEEAVSESHVAWQASPSSPDAFEHMIEIHCLAAAANPEPKHYEAAQRWLMCAFGHDASDTRLRNLIAERHYLHAAHLHGRGLRKQTLATLERCLALDPEHAKANALQEEVMRG